MPALAAEQLRLIAHQGAQGDATPWALPVCPPGRSARVHRASTLCGWGICCSPNTWQEGKGQQQQSVRRGWCFPPCLKDQKDRSTVAERARQLGPNGGLHPQAG